MTNGRWVLFKASNLSVTSAIHFYLALIAHLDPWLLSWAKVHQTLSCHRISLLVNRSCVWRISKDLEGVPEYHWYYVQFRPQTRWKLRAHLQQLLRDARSRKLVE